MQNSIGKLCRRDGLKKPGLTVDGFFFVHEMIALPWERGGLMPVAFTYLDLAIYVMGIILYWLPTSNVVFHMTRAESRESLRQANLRIAKKTST